MKDPLLDCYVALDLSARAEKKALADADEYLKAAHESIDLTMAAIATAARWAALYDKAARAIVAVKARQEADWAEDDREAVLSGEAARVASWER
jgi:hypothetical protein